MMAVPKRVLVVRIAAAAKMVKVSGAGVLWDIQTCRTPAASAAAMADNVSAESVPYMASPTRSRAGCWVDVCAVAGGVSLFCMSQLLSWMVLMLYLIIAIGLSK